MKCEKINRDQEIPQMDEKGKVERVQKSAIPEQRDHVYGNGL